MFKALVQQFRPQHLHIASIGRANATALPHELAELRPFLRAERCASRDLCIPLPIAANAGHANLEWIEQVLRIPLPCGVGLDAARTKRALQELREGKEVVGSVVETSPRVMNRWSLQCLRVEVVALFSQRPQALHFAPRSDRSISLSIRCRVRLDAARQREQLANGDLALAWIRLPLRDRFAHDVIEREHSLLYGEHRRNAGEALGPARERVRTRTAPARKPILEDHLPILHDEEELAVHRA